MSYTKNFSYPCLKAIVQHMNPNYRYLLVSRSPSLRTIHQNVPLKVKELIFKEASFTVDGIEHLLSMEIRKPNGKFPNNPHPHSISYDFDSDGRGEYEPTPETGDIQLFEPWTLHTRVIHKTLIGTVVYTAIDESDKREEPEGLKQSRYPPGYKLRDAFRNLIGNFMNAYTTVKTLNIFMFETLRLPLDLKFKVQRFEIPSGIPEIVRSLINPSYPLANLTIRVSNPNRFQISEEFLSSTNRLTIGRGGKTIPFGSWGEAFARIAHKSIRVHRECDQRHLNFVVEHWLNYPRETGAKIEFQTEWVQNKMDRVITQILAVRGVFKKRRHPDFPYCGTIQVSRTSELNIYGSTVLVENSELWKKSITVLVFEVMELESARRI